MPATECCGYKIIHIKRSCPPPNKAFIRSLYEQIDCTCLNIQTILSPQVPSYSHDHCLQSWCWAKWQSNINTSTSAACAWSGAWIRSRKPPRHASCESWSIPQRNPITCRILFKVNQGHGRCCRYYCHFRRVKRFEYWIKILKFICGRVDCALFKLFNTQISVVCWSSGAACM